MPVFFSPISAPGGWTLSHELMEIPGSLRYGGYEFRALRCTIGAAASVAAPFQSVLKKFSSGGRHVIELHMLPFVEAALTQSLSGGTPTCYLSFADDTGFASLNDDSHLDGGDVLRTADSVVIAMVFQDRVVRDPHYWAKLMLDALTAESIGTAEWAPFNTAVDGAFGGNDAPVLLLDARGALTESADVEVVYNLPGGEQVHHLTMTAADEGDLQQTVSRMGLPIPDLWSTAGTFTLRLAVPAAQRLEWQFAGLENQSQGSGEITVTPAARHIQAVHLHDWFAPQFAAGSPLSRFSRGNKLKTFVNGKEFFGDFFRELYTAGGAGLGLHHVGYLIMHEDKLIKLKDDDPPDLKLTLKDAMQRISDGGGKVRLLPAQFFNLSPEAPIDDTSVALMLILYLALSGSLILYEADADLFGMDFGKVDTVGLAITIALLFSTFFIPLIVPNILIDGDGLVTFEKNKGVRDFTEGLTNGRAIISPYPASIEDNPDAQTNWLIDIGMNFINQFGIYHQKYSILKNASGHIAYCGGMDLNPDRIDDENHMAANPYHDTHLRIEGPAAADVAQTFQEHWVHEDDTAPGPDVAFPVPDAATLGTPGEQIIQFGRTYFQPAAPAKALPFATNGDRTILDTIINAINQVKEYIYIEDQYFTPPPEYKTALLNKVANRKIKKLVIVVPDNTDQPFGDIEKQGLIDDLSTAQSTLLPGETVPPSILHIGYPRRNYHLPDNSVRASSGKCILEVDLPKNAGSMSDEEIVLGVGSRLPGVPFYMAIEGEIIYAYKLKETSPSAAAAGDAKTARQTKRTYIVLRGDDLPVMGTERKGHKKGAAVSVLEYKSIYVHSKTMIVDDVFLCQGSANVNQRGHYHDGEANIFCIPQNLKNGKNNLVRDLRIRLWAEMLNLPEKMAAGILRDPIAAAELFERTPQQGNRVVNLVGRPPMMVLGPTAGTGMLPMILTGLGTIAVLPNLTYDKFYKCVVDPASGLKP